MGANQSSSRQQDNQKPEDISGETNKMSTFLVSENPLCHYRYSIADEPKRGLHVIDIQDRQPANTEANVTYYMKPDLPSGVESAKAQQTSSPDQESRFKQSNLELALHSKPSMNKQIPDGNSTVKLMSHTMKTQVLSSQPGSSTNKFANLCGNAKN